MINSRYIIKKVETPYYLIDETKLDNNLKMLKEAFNKCFNHNVIYSYSFKTNSLPWILDWFKEKGIYAEVVSEVEYNLAKNIGFKEEKIIFNGPYKGELSLINALNEGAIVNLDSFDEIELIKLNKHKMKRKRWKVGLRINFDLESLCPGETIMGKELGRFGFNIENKSFENAVKELEKVDYVDIVGLHGHNSTKTKSLKIFREIARKMVNATDLISNKIEYLDIGGCLFGDKPGAPKFEEYANVIKKEFLRKYDSNDIKLIVEPGAALIASPISYMCQATSSKVIDEKIFIGTNGSLHHINPAMSGVNFKINCDRQYKENAKKQVVVGYTCIEKDRIGIINDMNNIKNGDYLSIENVGAYSMALSPLFIQYYPAVYVLKNDKYYSAREVWGIEEFKMKSNIGYNKEI